jgi:hypothetical protein
MQFVVIRGVVSSWRNKAIKLTLDVGCGLVCKLKKRGGSGGKIREVDPSVGT